MNPGWRERGEWINGDIWLHYRENLKMINDVWQDLKPWKEQTEVQKFLFNYLCK